MCIRDRYLLRGEINQTLYGKHIFFVMLIETAKRLKIDNDRIYELGVEEITDLLRGKKTKKVFKKTYAVGKFSGWKPLLGKEAKKVIGEIKKAKDKIGTEL